MSFDLTTDLNALLDQQKNWLASSPPDSAGAEGLIEAIHALVEPCSEHDLHGFADALALYAELIAALPAELPPPLELMQAVESQMRALVSGETSTPDPLLALYADTRWPEPLPEEDAEFLHPLLLDDCATLAASRPAKPAVPDTQAGPTSADESVSGSVKVTEPFCTTEPELLEQTPAPVDPDVPAMLAHSLSDLAGQWAALSPEQAGPASVALRERLIPVMRALESLGLHGLQKLIGGLEHNLRLLGDSHEHCTPPQFDQIAACFGVLVDLLQQPESVAVQRATLKRFEGTALPCPLDEETLDYLAALLRKVTLQTSADIEQEQASPDDVVLRLQEDIDPNLQDMLFVELPSLVDSFLDSVQQLTTAQDRSALTLAQRNAHTIKGLANMAGITGIANLTHRLEDIFDQLVAHQSLPGKVLQEDLLEAADCLAAMGEAITDNAPAPDNSLAILQRVMDWAYRLKAEGIDAAGSAMPARDAEPPGDESCAEDSAPPPAATATPERNDENHLRVPQSLLDNLFRITGESSTLTAQLDAELSQLRRLTRVNRERQRGMQRMIFELEQQLQEYYTLHPELDPDSETFDPLEMDSYNELHSSLSRLHESAADVREVEQEMDGHIRLLSDLHVAQSGLQKESMASVLSTRLVAVKSITSRVQRIMRQACRAAGKTGQLVIEGEETRIDSQILAQLTDPLMHIIRNAVDHGLESPDARHAAGKPESGTLTLRFRQVNDEIRVSFEDDGGGIDTDRIRAVAEAKGLIDPGVQLSRGELQRLILLPGFSTRDAVSQLSGRGIGMDVVYQQISRLQGSLQIDSEPGLGTRFELAMPASSLMIRALLVTAGRQTIALSSHGIEQSLLSMDGRFEERPDGARFITADQDFPAYRLETLLSEPLLRNNDKAIHPVLVINLGQGEQVAVLVREVLAHRELVFKSMGNYVPDIPGIPGVTILSNGEAAPVVDLPARIHHLRSGRVEASRLLEQDAELALPRVMVVDDSVSARKSMAQFLRDSGYEVATALDGLDALNQIRKRPPDLVVTDLEMPRMSGIELSAALRRSDVTGHIPVIMVTSRSTDKHRQEAGNAGVTDYLTKPWTESRLLDCIQNHMP